MGEDYYRQKFLELVDWLNSREQYHERIAQEALDHNKTSEAAKSLYAGNTAKCARMWIRNHVLLSEKESK